MAKTRDRQVRHIAEYIVVNGMVIPTAFQKSDGSIEYSKSNLECAAEALSELRKEFQHSSSSGRVEINYSEEKYLF